MAVRAGTPNASSHIDIKQIMHHDGDMRTTLTLDPDVAERIRQEIHKTGKGLKAVVNDALRLGLSLQEKPAQRPRYKVVPFSSEYVPGVDPNKLNQLADELEMEETLEKMRRHR